MRKLSFIILLLTLVVFACQKQETGTTGTVTVPASKYKEAPMLADRVAKGELPPVAQRLPDEPVVQKPLESVGKYGGTIKVFATSNQPWEDLGEEPERGGYMLKIDPSGAIVGDMAKSYEQSADGKTFTLYMRKGMKWSNGDLFTADDVVFFFHDILWDAQMESWNFFSDMKAVDKVDDYTVKFGTDIPYPVMPVKLTTPEGGDWLFFQPKNYLQKWHIKYNPDAEKLAKAEGFSTWVEAFHSHYWWAPQKDLNKPSLQPWILKEFTTTTKLSERNPYYYKIDTEGNQLPYIDKIQASIVDQESYNLKIISGEADVAFVHTTFDNFTLFKENETKAGYRVISLPGKSGTEAMVSINQNHPDPMRRSIYTNVKFRQALSVAINRKEINDVVYSAKAVPRQETILPDARFYKKEWGESFAQFDTKLANSLLDEVGLAKKDKDGFRIGPDGTTFSLLIEYGIGGEVAAKDKIYQLIKDYWQAVGLKTDLKPEDQSLLDERSATANHEIIGAGESGSADEYRNYESSAEQWADGGSGLSWGRNWAIWFDADNEIKSGRKTLADYGGKMPGEEPPVELKEAHQWAIDRNMTAFGSKEYIELSQKIFDFNMKQLYMIGTVGMAPQLYIAKKNIGNVPTKYSPGATWGGDLNYTADQLYFK